MTFGQTLKQLLDISGVKANYLADSLGYDASYISRWINDQKLPSLKNNHELFDKIASIIVKNCDGAAIDRLVAAYEGSSETALQDSIAESLKSTHKRSIFSSSLPSTAPNSILVFNNYIHNIYSMCSAAVLKSAEEKQSTEVNCTCSMPLSKYDNKTSAFWTNIINHPEITDRIKLVVHQIVDMGDFSDNIDLCCSAICTLICFHTDLKYEFYTFDEPDTHLIDFTTIEDNILVHSIFNKFTGTFGTLVSTDKSILTVSAAQLRNKLLTCQKLLVYTSGNTLNSSYFLHDFVMDGDLCYLLNIMQPIYMEDDLAKQIAEKYLPELADKDLRLTRHSLFFRTPKEVILYRSALLEYIYNGTIYIFGNKVTIAREDRTAHLEQLLLNLEQGDCRFYVLNDINPLLSREDMKLNLYLSKNNGFGAFTASGHEENFIQLTSNQAVKYFNVFFNHLHEQSSEYVISGKEAEDLIKRGLQFM